MEKSLKDLIARLPIPGLRESADRHTIAERISKELNISIKPNQVTLKDGTLTLAVPPIVKSALRTRQEKIKDLFKNENIFFETIR